MVLDYAKVGIDWHRWRVMLAAALIFTMLIVSHSLAYWLGHSAGVTKGQSAPNPAAQLLFYQFPNSAGQSVQP